MFEQQENDIPQIVTEEAPTRFLDPITYEIMVDPVMIETGHVYDRQSIVNWFSRKASCPKTNLPVVNTKLLIPAHDLRGEIIEWNEKQAKRKLAEKNPSQIKGKEKEKEKEPSNITEKSEQNLNSVKFQANIRLLNIQLGMVEQFISRIKLKDKSNYLDQVVKLSQSIIGFNKKVIRQGDISQSETKTLSKEYASLGTNITQLFNNILMKADELSEEQKNEFWLLFDSSLNLNQDVRNIQSASELEEIFHIAETRKNSFSNLLFKQPVQSKLYSTSTYSPMLHATTRTPPGAYDEFLKIFLVGDSQSGKKSLLVRFADDTFTPHFLTTIGMDFKLRTIVIGDKRVKLQMWHNSNFGRRFANCSLKGIAIVGLVIDLTQLSKSNIEDSFAKWIKHIKTYNDEGTTIMVLGTKCDLSRNDISYEDFYLCAAKHGCLPAIVSAKTGEGIEEAFYHAAEMHLIKTGKISINSDNKEKGEKEENDETPEKSTNPGRCSLM